MSENSKRHHYIPRFYINNFCDKSGNIFVNDKLDSRNYDNISLKVPKTIFFEWNRNTFDINGQKSIVIEKIYGDIEDKIAPHLDKLVKSEGNGSVQITDVEVLRNLIFLGYLTKWRVPSSDSYVRELNSTVSFDDLNFFAKTESEIFSINGAWPPSIEPEIKRLIFPTLLFNNPQEYAKLFKNTFIISFPEPLFITDNPFVEFLTTERKDFPSFIFPLSSNLLLVYCDYIDKAEFAHFVSNSTRYHEYLKLLYNSILITLMWHANKYIGCEDKDYLKYYLSVVSDVSDKIEAKGFHPPSAAFTTLANFKEFIK